MITDNNDFEDDITFEFDGTESLYETKEENITDASVEDTEEKNEEKIITEEKESTSKEVTFEIDEKGSSVEKDDDASEDGNEDSPTVASPVVQALAKAFTEEGIFDASEDEIKNIKGLEDIRDMISKTIKKNEFSDLGEKGKEFVEAIRAGVPFDTVAKTYNTELTLESLKEEDFIEADGDEDEVAEQKKQTRENLIYQDYLTRGYSAEKAKKLTDRSFKTGEDEEDAKAAIISIQEKVKEKKNADLAAAVERAKTIEEQKTKFIEELNGKTEIVPGIKLTEKSKEQLVKAMTAPTGRRADGSIRTFVSDKRDEDPQRFNTLLNYYIQIGLFEKQPDLSVLKSSKVTSATKELEKNLTTEGFYEGGKGMSLKNLSGKTSRVDYSILDNLEF